MYVEYIHIQQKIRHGLCRRIKWKFWGSQEHSKCLMSEGKIAQCFNSQTSLSVGEKRPEWHLPRDNLFKKGLSCPVLIFLWYISLLSWWLGRKMYWSIWNVKLKEWCLFTITRILPIQWMQPQKNTQEGCLNMTVKIYLPYGKRNSHTCMFTCEPQLWVKDRPKALQHHQHPSLHQWTWDLTNAPECYPFP